MSERVNIEHIQTFVSKTSPEFRSLIEDRIEDNAWDNKERLYVSKIEVFGSYVKVVTVHYQGLIAYIDTFNLENSQIETLFISINDAELAVEAMKKASKRHFG